VATQLIMLGQALPVYAQHALFDTNDDKHTLLCRPLLPVMYQVCICPCARSYATVSSAHEMPRRRRENLSSQHDTQMRQEPEANVHVHMPDLSCQVKQPV
jgi:hypothetical protein